MSKCNNSHTSSKELIADFLKRLLAAKSFDAMCFRDIMIIYFRFTNVRFEYF